MKNQKSKAVIVDQNHFAFFCKWYFCAYMIALALACLLMELFQISSSGEYVTSAAELILNITVKINDNMSHIRWWFLFLLLKLICIM